MDVETFRNYCILKKGVTEEFPFDEVTLTFKVMGKIFAIAGLDQVPLAVNLKCDPERSIDLRDRYDGDIMPGYHMNKLHWNTVQFETGLPDALLLELIDHSYQLVLHSLPKKTLAAWEQL